MHGRRKGREAALQILFQMDASDVDAERAIKLYQRYLKQSEEGLDFAKELVLCYSAAKVEVDEKIRVASHHWRLERMGRVDRNILRLGIAELMKKSEIPKRVTLNEAVELAKRYGSEGSPAFVNGVLDRIATELGKD